MIRDAIDRLVRGQSLDEDEAATVMEEIMTGEATPAQLAAFLVALRAKGETAAEIAGMAAVMREKALRVEAGGGLLDTCGTGGAHHTFNVSTAAALVCAGAGARIAKHGNRAMSSASGSADLLEALGVKIDLDPAGVRTCIDEAGIGFMFAQVFHPSMKHAAPVRREIGIRTVFNILGPLTNPAGAEYQVLGVARPDLAPIMIEALRRLGSIRALVVHGEDGDDELSITGPTLVVELSKGDVTEYRVAPEDVGLSRAGLKAILSSSGEQNADTARALLEGRPGPARDITVLNAAAGLLAAGLADSWPEAVALAAKAIDSGDAARSLARWADVSQRAGAPDAGN
jgi:anthranilate phosphoribosyltransferase